MIAADIFRVADGKVAEHREVMLDKSAGLSGRKGNPIFSSALNAAGCFSPSRSPKASARCSASPDL
jgi:hypothetical protein